MAGREDIARAQWRELLPTAHLLTGDQVTARRLVVRTLAGTRRGTDPADRDAVVAALVRTHRSRWRATGRATIQGDAPALWWASAADVAAAHHLAAELDTLDRDERTAVVLRWSEDWSPERIAELVPHVDTDALLDRITVAPADLPRRLDDLAALSDPAALDDDEVVASVREVSGRRVRRTGLAAAALAAVVALGVWAPTVPGPTDRATAASSTAVRTPVTPPLAGIFALPPRGELAGDAALLPQLQRQVAGQEGTGAGYRVLYGEDVEGVRVVLMMDPVGARVDLAWLTGPAGTDPADLDVARFDDSFYGTDTAVAVAVEDPDGGPVRLVVLTEEGTAVEVSPGIDVDPVTGVAERTFAPATASDGVVALTLDRPTGPAVRFRVDDGSGVAGEQFALVAGPDRTTTPNGPGPPSRSGAPTASAYAYQTALSVITSSTGWAAEDLDVVVLGAGTAPGPGSASEDVVSLAAVLPGGAVVTTTGMGSYTSTATGSTSSWTGCGSTSYPAGTDPAGLVVAATCPSPTSDRTGERAAVVAAVPGSTVVLTGPDGTTTTPELVNGFGYTTYLAGRDLDTATAGDAVFPVAGPANDALPD